MIHILTTIALSVQIDPALLRSICWVESNHKNVINKDDGGSPSYGICQMKVDTADWMHKRFRMYGESPSARSLMIPEVNAFYAALFLKYQGLRYGGVQKKMISAYNAGSYFTGNSEYVDKVLKRFKLESKECLEEMRNGFNNEKGEAR